MKDCLFCKIINGEIDVKILYEDDFVIAFNDINPQNTIHILIVPKKHIDMIENMSEDEVPLIGRIVFAAKKIAKSFNLQNGFRLVFNDGVVGGQTVNHIHLHLLSGEKMGWPPFKN